MKKNTLRNLSGLTLTAALALSLTACGTGTSAASGSDLAPAKTTAALAGQGETGTVGTLLLSVNPEIEMDYDASGNVVALTGRNEDGQAVLAACTVGYCFASSRRYSSSWG